VLLVETITPVPVTESVGMENANSGIIAGESTHIVIDELETEVQISKMKKVSVKKAKFNWMGIINVVEKGHQKTRDTKIPEHRYQCKCRIA
jgi:hypothetical protein